MSFQVDTSELKVWAAAIETAPERVKSELIVTTNAVIVEGIGMAQEKAPHEEGSLRASIVVLEAAHHSGDAVQGSFGSTLEYAWQREEGGTIYPRNGRYLVFPDPSGATDEDGKPKLIFAASVTQEGSHYMRDTAEELQPRATEAYGMALERAVWGAS